VADLPSPALAFVDKLSTGSLLVGYIVVWLLVGVLVRSVLRRSLHRLAVAQPSPWLEVLAASLPRPAGIAVFLVAMSAGLRFLPLTEPTATEVRRWLPTLLAILGVVVLMRVGLRAIEAFGRQSPELKSSAGIGRAVTWVVGLALCAVLASDALGVSLAPALAALGVGSLAVALALQDTLSNFFAGLYLVVDKHVRPGDFVRVDPSYEGFVEGIGWRSTHLRTLADNLVIIPNGTLSKAIVTNYSRPTLSVATSVRIDVAFDADPAAVEALLADTAKKASDLPGVDPTSTPVVLFAPGVADGGLCFTVGFTVKSFSEQGRAQSAMRKKLVERLRHEGIALSRGPVVVSRT
jgi:small-conductance mechanosensitive channel